MHSLFIRVLRELGVSDPEEWANLLNAGLRIFLILVIAWLALLVAGRLIRIFRRYMERQDTDPEQVKRVETLAQVFRYMASVIVVIVAGMLVLSELGISIAPVLATAGVAGVAIGFGAQSLVKDYFTGFCILIENQIRQGDAISIGPLNGIVEEMTLRYVRLRDYDGSVHYIPNGSIITLTNRSRGFAYAVIDVIVAYGEDLDVAMHIMEEVGAELRTDKTWAPHILGDLEMAGIEKFSGTGNVLRCRFRTPPLGQWSVKREYLRRVKHRFDAQGFKAPAA